jgi:hypothetical protein
MIPRNLPPLEVGTPYVAADFQEFEYVGSLLTGSTSILRLHLKNGTTIDLPASDDALRYLLTILCEAFPRVATAHVRERGWTI